MRISPAFRDIAPFALWMALMTLLPSEPWAYAVRTVLVLTALLWLRPLAGLFGTGADIRRAFAWGVPAGLLVLAIWVLPESSAWYRRWCILGSTANAAVDASVWPLKAIRLFGSAFVISVAEEIFFRRWLLKFAGFFWMVALFAVEHDRWLVAAIAGTLYGLLAVRKGLGSAIIAHAVTNLALGLHVLLTDNWAFW